MAARYRRLETWLWQTPIQTVPLGGVLWLRAPKGAVVELSFGQYICYSVFFSVSGGPYNQVCGRIRAYQKGLPSAYNFNGKTSVDDAYNYTSVVCLYCMAVLDSTSGSLLQEGGKIFWSQLLSVWHFSLHTAHLIICGKGLLLWVWDCVPWCPWFQLLLTINWWHSVGWERRSLN